MIKLGITGLFGLVVFAGIVLVLTFVLTSWLGRPVILGAEGFREGPEQPISFPHETHVKKLDMDCTYCHRTVAKAASAHIPAVELCASCHRAVGSYESEDLIKLRATSGIFENSEDKQVVVDSNEASPIIIVLVISVVPS